MLARWRPGWRIFARPEGQTLVEYALIVVLLAVVVALTRVGHAIATTLGTVNNASGQHVASTPGQPKPIPLPPP